MQSLAAQHPWRLDIPVLLGLSLVLLIQGVTRPAVEINAFIFWHSEYSIITNIVHLHNEGRLAAAMILGFCSVGYPVFKILILSYLLLAPFPARWRRRLVRMLRLLGRWSMLDVMAVAAIVIGSQVVFLVEANPLPGLYIYAASMIVLMFATILMDGVAREKHSRRR